MYQLLLLVSALLYLFKNCHFHINKKRKIQSKLQQWQKRLFFFSFYFLWGRGFSKGSHHGFQEENSLKFSTTRLEWSISLGK